MTVDTANDRWSLAGAVSVFVQVAALMALMAAVRWLNLGEANSSVWRVAGSVLLSLSPLLMLGLLEHFLPKGGPVKPRAIRFLHIKVSIAYFIGEGLAVYAMLPLLRWLGEHAATLIDLRFASVDNIGSMVGALLLTMLVQDFFGYWNHRAQHKSMFLWQHHKLHHSDRHFDIWTTYVNNWMEIVIGTVLVGVPLSLFVKLDQFDGLSGGIWLLSLVFLRRLITHFNHWNVGVNWGWVNLLVSTPQVHRIHHSLEERHFDKNFAFFPIWDMLFGTYHRPRRDEFPLTGVADEPGISSIWESQIFTVREMWRFLRNKIAALH